MFLSREEVKASVERDRQRVIQMDQWYVQSGRHRPDHPLHGLYTGLKEEMTEKEKSQQNASLNNESESQQAS